MSRPEWLDGVLSGTTGLVYMEAKREGSPTFMRAADGTGRVHVADRSENGPLPFTAVYTMACGHRGAEYPSTGVGVVQVDTFADEDLCGRCLRAAGDHGDELFRHPTREDEDE